LSDGSLVKVLPGIPTARGVAVADALGRIFVTSSPNQLVIIDSASLTEISRVTTGNSPDGVAWDPVDQIVGVSDQGDGAVSLIANAGSGVRTQVPIGTETGNVVHDASRGRFWVTVVNTVPPDQLVAIDPVAATVTTRIDLPGCSGAAALAPGRQERAGRVRGQFSPRSRRSWNERDHHSDGRNFPRRSRYRLRPQLAIRGRRERYLDGI
jgi:YVTN family beta-propeller protein